MVAVIISNIPRARDAHDPNINWVPALAVQTRSQAKQPEQTKHHSKPPILSIGIFHLNKLRKPKLMIILWQEFEKLAKNQNLKEMLSFFFSRKNDLIYRQFSSPNVEFGKTFIQLVAPQQYRKMVMKLAHESILSGLFKRYYQNSFGQG